MKVKILCAVAALAVASATAAMGVETYDQTVGGTNGYPGFRGSPVYVIENTVDLSTTLSDETATGDIIKFVNIPAGSVVLGVTYQIPTALTNSTTIDIGDSGSATRFANNVDVTSATYETETLSATPVLKTSASDLRVTCDGALGGTGVITLKAVLLNAN